MVIKASTNAYIKQILGESEEVLLVVRQHWFVLLQEILIEILFILGLSALTSLLVWFLPAYPFLALLWILVIIPIGSMIKDILVWTNHQYIVTSRRVIQTRGILDKNVIDSSLEKVNDVKMEQPFWGRIFNFGNIEILTASELGVNLFKNIGDPIRFKTTMLNAKMKLSDEDQSVLRGRSIPELIEELGQLKQKGILTEEEFKNKKTELLSKM
jgi:uncharacterized membrane protein YdbT with pleckstrin-like domain